MPQDTPFAGRGTEGPISQEPVRPPRRRRKTQALEDIHGELNLTAMIDMMTILLVFLIKSYSVSAVNISPSNELQPPKATSPEAIVEATKITLTKNLILVDEKPITLEETGGKLTLIPSDEGPVFPASVVEKDSVYLVPALLKELEKSAAKQQKSLLLQKRDLHATLLLIADSDIPFHTISQVVYTAGQVQITRPDGVQDGWFDEYRFVVVIAYR